MGEDWEVVRRLMNWSRTVAVDSGSLYIETPPEQYFNLPLVLAYGVLEQALREVFNQDPFPCPNPGSKTWGPSLTNLLIGAETRVPWQNYSLVLEGMRKRDHIAHHGKLLSQTECRIYIQAIDAELRAWGIKA